MPAVRTNPTSSHSTIPLSRNRSGDLKTRPTSNDVIEVTSDEELPKPRRKLRSVTNNAVADLRDVSVETTIVKPMNDYTYS